MNPFEPNSDDTMLDDILNDVLLAAETANKPFSHQEIKRWTTRFPQYEHEITRFFVTEAQLEVLPEQAVSASFTERYAARKSEVLAGILAAQRAGGSAEPGVRDALPLESLQKAAAAVNLKFPELARKAGMSLQLLLSLEQRLVKATTISEKAKTRLAAALKTSLENINAYFVQPPQFLQGASYKAADQPEIGEQKDFAELVKADLKLTADQKQELLD